MKHIDPRDAVYGIPELHPEVAEQTFIANPGCYPTGASLASAPLADAGLIERAVFDSKSGISGAGVEPTQTSIIPTWLRISRHTNSRTTATAQKLYRNLPVLTGSLKRSAYPSCDTIGARYIDHSAYFR